MDGCGLIKASYHKSFSKQYRAISERPIRTNFSNVSRKILSQKNSLYRKIVWTESFISKVASYSRSIQHLISEALPEAFSKAFPVPCFTFFHSPFRVLMIAFYYAFTNVLFTTHYNKYMAYEIKLWVWGVI